MRDINDKIQQPNAQQAIIDVRSLSEREKDLLALPNSARKGQQTVAGALDTSVMSNLSQTNVHDRQRRSRVERINSKSNLNRGASLTHG